MSVIWSSINGWILCHSTYLHELYKVLDMEQVCPDCGKYEIFHIHLPFLRQDQTYQTEFLPVAGSKRKLSWTDDADEVTRVEEIFKKIINSAKEDNIDYFNKECCRAQFGNGNLSARNAANNILKNNPDLKLRCFNGGNTNCHPICIPFQKISYFIPPLCTFFSCCVENFETKLRKQSYHNFDVIVLDPPWWNKYVRRKNAQTLQAGYKMMYDEQLSKIPIDSLLCSNGLVVVWCTNSQQHINYLFHKIFPAWKVEYICSWYWIKVTEDGQPICQFTSREGKKKPYERIIFASRTNRWKEFKNPEADKLIVSIPSAIHSHKPPLTEVLSEYIPHNARCLEMFARYLLPNWTSTGNEVLKLQQQILFASPEK